MSNIEFFSIHMSRNFINTWWPYIDAQTALITTFIAEIGIETPTLSVGKRQVPTQNDKNTTYD